MIAFAVIWDMDGVIVDSAQLHFRSWRAAFRSYNVGFIYEDFRHTFGQKNEVAIKHILGPKTDPAVVASIARKKEECFRALIQRGELEIFAGAKQLIRALYKTGVSLALASSAPRENIDLILRKLKLRECFPVIVSEEDVTGGKPDPQVFLIAAARLNVPPRRCLVIEDAVAGVAAARSAGMKCIAVTNTNTAAALKDADLIVDSLKLVSADTIKCVFSR